MPRGQDSILPTFNPKKGIKQFYTSKPWQEAQRAFAQQKHGLGRQLVENPALGQGLKEGVSYILSNKKRDIEHHFGKGSADWLKENLEGLSPQELYQFHDMFSNLKPAPINDKMIPHTGEQIRLTSPGTGTRG